MLPVILAVVVGGAVYAMLDKKEKTVEKPKEQEIKVEENGTEPRNPEQN